MTWLDRFPALGTEQLSALRRFIDGAFRAFTREHGQAMEQLFEPLRQFLLASERLLTQTPWPVVVGVIAVVAWVASRNWKIVLGAILSLLVIGWLGMWDDTMKTISMIFVSTVVALVVGLPIGILMSRWDRMQRIVNPALDVMQTMPSFVYLIPVVMLLGIGRVPGLIAVVIYAVAPVIRFTNLGIRLVDKDLLEAADAFGSSAWQKMRQVQLPLGAAHHHGRHQPDHHARAVDGGHRLDDRCAGPWPAGAQGHLQPVLHDGHPQRHGHRRDRDHLRPRLASLRQASAEASGGSAWLIPSSSKRLRLAMRRWV